MINQILHALSNRKGPFETPALIGDPSFIPLVLSSEAGILQKIFNLDLTTNDYYLKLYLAMFEAFPEFKRRISTDPVTYRLQDMLPRGVDMDGGDFLGGPGSSGFFTDPLNTSLPLGLTYDIFFYENQICQLKILETGVSQLANCIAIGTDPAKILQIDWPDNFPFQGNIQLNQPWETNACIRIMVEPSRFPYDVLLEKLQQRAYVTQLLLRANWVAEFGAANDSVEKVMVILAAFTLNLAGDNPL